MPFENGPDAMWFCSHCALIEGALMVNPQWLDHLHINRIDFQKPRQKVIAMLGEENQWLPVLVIDDGLSITDPIEITTYLAKTYGGAAPHP